MNFIRIVHAANLLSNDGKIKDENFIHVLVFGFTKSKISTSLLGEGSSPYDVLDKSPDLNDPLYCTTMLAFTKIQITFPSVPNAELDVYRRETMFTLNPGDAISYIGILPTNIEVFPSNNLYNTDFMNFEFAVHEKKQKGVGKNKYKVAITFSDEYEIDVYANNEEDAKRTALSFDFADWDHIYDYIDMSDFINYRSQAVRHTCWHPKQIYIKK